MTEHQINRNCMECFKIRERFFCDVRRLFYQLHVPLQEQIVLMNIANKRKMNCESFKNILLFLLQSKSMYGINRKQ
jgi:hypothetical protein